MYIPYLSKSGTEGDSKYPNITDSYTTRPLRGVVSSTLVEVDTYPSDWNEEDEIQSRNSWLLGLISLSYMANAAYCANVSFVIDLVPHWDKRARVSLPSVGTALLRNYSTEIFANMGISALREYQEQVSASWKRAGVAIDDSFISFAILTRLKSSYLNPCGISTGGVNAFIVRIQTSDCSHWEGYTLVMHETLHVFQACDEYGDCECECKRSWCIDEPPYYCTNNLNCHRCMPAHKCVMGVDWTHPCVCPWTALQVGWGPMARDDVICNLPILPGSAYVSANGCPGQQHQSMVLLYFLLVIMAFQ
ncbi:hypothetical protein Pelo_11140 [Pelomyxa schiedti]|nr:hypothetical protein Pelo_11140 [Pelomyxa schiedti]